VMMGSPLKRLTSYVNNWVSYSVFKICKSAVLKSILR
jgi:hypothetical protein